MGTLSLKFNIFKFKFHSKEKRPPLWNRTHTDIPSLLLFLRLSVFVNLILYDHFQQIVSFGIFCSSIIFYSVLFCWILAGLCPSAKSKEPNRPVLGTPIFEIVIIRPILPQFTILYLTSDRDPIHNLRGIPFSHNFKNWELLFFMIRHSRLALGPSSILPIYL